VADVEAAGPPVGGELHRDLDEADFLAVFPLEPARGGLVLSESFTTTGPIGIPFCWTRCQHDTGIEFATTGCPSASHRAP
jgi:hypothetical protein